MVLADARLQKTIEHDLHVVASFQPDIVILQLGSNDLTSDEPAHVGSAIDDLVKLWHDVYGVKFICVCQTIHRKGASAFNRHVGILTQYLRVVLDPIPYALFWGHRVFGAQSIISMHVMVCILTIEVNKNFIVVSEGQF